MTVENNDRGARVPRLLYRAIDRERRRIAKASAVLRCLILVSRHLPAEPIEVELLAAVARNLIERAIDRLERLPLTTSGDPL